jgi:Txe/YoeB family toxin of Txe-Axe toxin-antitoxin module
MNIEIKDTLQEAREQQRKILEIAKQNCNHPFFIEIQKKFQPFKDDEGKILSKFGNLLHKLIYPISENKRIIGRYSAAINSWFESGNTYSYHKGIEVSPDFIFKELSENHVNLISDVEKHEIAKSFYDFKNKSLTNISQIIFDPSIIVSGYKVGNIVFDASNTFGFHNEYFIHLLKKTTERIQKVVFKHRLYPFNVIIEFQNRSNDFKFDYNISTEGIGSSLYRNLHNIKTLYIDEVKIVCLDDPNVFLTNEVKNVINKMSDDSVQFLKDWNALKMKYAHVLLQNGNI